MYKYYNAHPTGVHTGDCVKRAITVASGIDYKTVQRELNQYKKTTGADTFNSDDNPHKYVENVLKAEKIPCPSGMTGAQFCQIHPTGRFILDMPTHWSCCVDGIIYDTWDVSDTVVCCAYKVDLTKEKREYRRCCTAEEISDTETCIRIYDGNGICSTRTVPTRLAEGYIRCLEDQHYSYVKF